MQVTPAPGSPHVLMDFSTAVRAIYNLCLNAGEAILPGSGAGVVTLVNECVCLDAVRAARVKRTDGDPFLCCGVSDTGMGISPEVVARLFTPFVTTKPPGKGTGLGLAMVGRAVRRAGGFIELESGSGNGATFRLWLPLDPRAA